MPDCICTHNPNCLYHQDIAELVPDLDSRTIRVINRALSRQRLAFQKDSKEKEKLINEINERLRQLMTKS